MWRLVRHATTVVDVAALVAAVAAAAYLIFHRVDPERTDWFSVDDVRMVVAGVAALVVALGVPLRRRRVSTTRAARLQVSILRVSTVALSAALCLTALSRVRQRTSWHWPPRDIDSKASALARVPPTRRADWGARVAMHRVLTHEDRGPLTIPAHWMFPAEVTVAVDRGAPGIVRVWARTADGATRCVAMPRDRAATPAAPGAAAHGAPAHGAPAHGAPAHGAAVPAAGTGCAATAIVPDSARFTAPVRVTALRVMDTAARAGDPWPQYRRDAGKSGRSGSTGLAASWTSQLDGDVRSSFSVVGDLALIGAHGSGTLSAIDVRTGVPRWITRVPNWVHQDVVSDGRIAVVGFGDNVPSFSGQAPSGVAAYALATGEHRWTHFEETSVMTSPVVRDSFIVYATAAGTLHKRALETGALLGERQLPGGVIMGPPASVGDTIVFSLDLGGVCALLMSSLETLWCQSTPNYRLTGHSAPTVADGLVISTSTLLGPALTVRELAALPWTVQRRLLGTVIEPGDMNAGQRFDAFRLRDGARMWSSRFFAKLHDVEGHPSGTATVSDGVGLIVLPLADSIVAFDVRTGQERWIAPAHGSRGPPLVYGNVVINAGRDGTTEVRSLANGRLHCTMTRATGYDRAGPTVAGTALLFADLKGVLEAIPASSLLECDGVAVRAASR